MPLFVDEDLPFVKAVAELSHTNPFLPERMEWERRALGPGYVEETVGYWGYTPDQTVRRRTNLLRLIERARAVGETTRQKLRAGDLETGEHWNVRELQLYDDLAVYVLFYEMFDLWGRRDFSLLERDSLDQDAWRRFSPLFDHWFELGHHAFPTRSRRSE